MRKITSYSYKSYKEELDKLEQELKTNSERLQEAVSQGDLSENSEYDSAQDAIKTATERIKQIKAILKDATVIYDSNGPTIDIGSFFYATLMEDGKPVGEKQLFMLDMVERYTSGVIGIKSPLGKVIYGNTSGEFTINTENGYSICYRVDKVKEEDIKDEFLQKYPGEEKILTANLY